MDPSGMVHALEEVRRVLKPEGVLIDIRPLNRQWQIDVVTAHELTVTGHVDDRPEPLAADRASNAAMDAVAARGWFMREREEIFPFFYSWDTPREMEEFIDADWSDVIGLGEVTKRATRSVWASANADARVRVQVEILIARWKVVKDA